MRIRKTTESKNTDPRDLKPVEPLEGRLMLSSTAGTVSDVKNGPLANSGPELIALYREYRSFSIGGGTAPHFQSSDSNLFLSDGEVAVTVRGRSSLDAITAQVRAVGGTAFVRNSKLKTIDAFVSISQLSTLAVGGNVMSVRPIVRPGTLSVGNADNQADAAENADQGGTLFGVDGTGVKVGVLSDSVDRVGTGVPGSIATGNLPSTGIDIIADDTNPAAGSTDEGRAMLELIHDLAPGAALSFATADPSQSAMADNIRRLHANGECHRR